MIIMCPIEGCGGVLTQVKDNYVCDKCCYSRPRILTDRKPPSGVFQQQLFSPYPYWIPGKTNRSEVEQKSKGVIPARHELFTKEDLAGVIME